MESAQKLIPGEKYQSYTEKYEEMQEIGKGTFGTAYRVRRKRDRRLFCAKKIALIADPELVKQTL